MAIVRTRQASGCEHGPGCPHDIGAAAAGSDGLGALGRLSALRVPGLEGGAVAMGMGPIERRPATAAELARLDPPPVARPVRKDTGMHLMRPASRPAQQPPATTRTVAATPPAARTEAPATPAPTIEEDPVSIAAAPPAIPCGDCLHQRVCKYREDLEHAFERIALVTEQLTGPVRITSTASCGDYLAEARVVTSLGSSNGHLDLPVSVRPWPTRTDATSPEADAGEVAQERYSGGHIIPASIPTEPEPIRAEHGGESWRTPDPTRIATVQVASRRYPLPRDRAERDRVVLDAIRATSTVVGAAGKLGVSDSRIRQVLAEIRAAGTMPEDVAQLLASRGHHQAAAS